MVLLGLAVVTRGNDRVHHLLILGYLLLGSLTTDVRMSDQALEHVLQGFIGRLLCRQRGLQRQYPLVHGLQGVVLLGELVVAAAPEAGHLRVLVHLPIARCVVLCMRYRCGDQAPVEDHLLLGNMGKHGLNPLRVGPLARKGPFHLSLLPLLELGSQFGGGVILRRSAVHLMLINSIIIILYSTAPIVRVSDPAYEKQP